MVWWCPDLWLMTLGKNRVLNGLGVNNQDRPGQLLSGFQGFCEICRVGSAHRLGFASVMLTPRQSNRME
jgi:hypothetical protein